MVSRGELYASLTKFDFVLPTYVRTPGNMPNTAPASPLSLWHPSMDGRLKVHILWASYVNVKEAHKVSYKMSCVYFFSFILQKDMVLDVFLLWWDIIDVLINVKVKEWYLMHIYLNSSNLMF